MQTLTLDTATGQLGLFEEREAYEAFTEKFKADCMPIRALDAMAATGKAIFGSGYLLSFSAAAEKAAAVKWALSSRELDLIEQLSSSET